MAYHTINWICFMAAVAEQHSWVGIGTLCANWNLQPDKVNPPPLMMAPPGTRPSAMRNPPHIIAFSVALLLGLGSAGHAETLIQKAVGCLHLETLDRLHQLAQAGGRAALDFMKEQFKSGECSNLSQIGASVRADQRVKTEVCIVPAGSSEPCRWVPSQVVK